MNKYIGKRTYKSLENAKKSVEPYVFSDAPFIFRKRELPDGKIRVYIYDLAECGYPESSYVGWFGKQRMDKYYESIRHHYEYGGSMDTQWIKDMGSMH
jgi:hypothetical protein